jgi:hypothetical protein
VELPRELRALDEWRRQMTTELVLLPRTLRDLREGADNFKRVTQRLSDTTAAFDQVSDLQAGAWGEIRGRLEQANRMFREQVGSVPGGERVAGALDDLNESLSAVVRLNPFWPRVLPKEPPR